MKQSTDMCTNPDLIGDGTVIISHLIGQAMEQSPGDVEEVDRTFYFCVHILYPYQFTESDHCPMTMETIT